MVRRCFFCRKPLPVQKRAEMFCNLRCQELQRRLGGEGPAAGSSAPGAGPPHSRRPRGRPAPIRSPFRHIGRRTG